VCTVTRMLLKSSNILVTVHTSCHPTLPYHNNYNSYSYVCTVTKMLLKSSNILVTVHTSCHPTLQYHNYNNYSYVCTVTRMLLKSSNILVTVHTSCHPTLQYHTNYNRTENRRQWNTVRPPDDGRKDAQNMLRNDWLLINHYLLHQVGPTFIYI
jgi:nucleoside-triphosphatase THEP1